MLYPWEKTTNQGQSTEGFKILSRKNGKATRKGSGKTAKWENRAVASALPDHEGEKAWPVGTTCIGSQPKEKNLGKANSTVKKDDLTRIFFGASRIHLTHGTTWCGRKRNRKTDESIGKSSRRKRKKLWGGAN